MRQYASGIAVAIRNYHSFQKSMQASKPLNAAKHSHRRCLLPLRLRSWLPDDVADLPIAMRHWPSALNRFALIRPSMPFNELRLDTPTARMRGCHGLQAFEFIRSMSAEV
jgi:hypothetical protein